MKMDIIQPFVNAVDSVIAEIMGCPAQISDITMEAADQRQNGVAALVSFGGGMEGRAILDMDAAAALHVAKYLLAGTTAPTDDSVREAVCEVTNMIVGNAVTQLNDGGFRFKVFPPEIYASSEGLQSSADTEALVLRFETPHGNIVLNIALQYHYRGAGEVPTLTTA